MNKKSQPKNELITEKTEKNTITYDSEFKGVTIKAVPTSVKNKRARKNYTKTKV